MKARSLSILLSLLLAASVCAADQATKAVARDRYLKWAHPSQIEDYRSDAQRIFTLGDSPSELRDERRPDREVSSNWLDFNLTYLRNPGVAWGMFSGMRDPYRFWFLNSVTSAVAILILFFLFNLPSGRRVSAMGYGLILGGAAGNIVDRLRQGYVTDWLHVEWDLQGWSYSFPVFNGADVFINCGVIIFVAGEAFGSDKTSSSSLRGSQAS